MECLHIVPEISNDKFRDIRYNNNILKLKGDEHLMEVFGWVLWIAAMVLFGIIEASTVNMVSVWFVGGSLAALIVQLLGGGFWLQLGVFLAVSAGLLACLRPFVKRFVSPKRTATNADMAIGREAYLTETVDNLRETGALKLDGKEWTVRSASGDILPKGTLVKIVNLQGVKLYVEQVHTPVS